MTVSPFPQTPPRARLSLAAIGLTCGLVVYAIAVPLLHGDTGWKVATAAIVGGASALLVLVLLMVVRAATASAHAAMRAEISRLGAQVQEQASQLRQGADRLSAQSEQSAVDHETQAQLRAECDRLRQSNEDLRGQIDAMRRTVEHVTTELVPAALSGAGVSPGTSADGIDNELAKLMDEAVASAVEVAGQQASTRSAVVALSRRVQASAHRIQEEATLMADRHPGDADVLEVSMRVDHAAAQQARNAQSMAVLCGEWPGQQWPEPLPLVDVVRAAAGRIIAYRRIEVAGDPDIAAAAPVVEPLIHLVAELLANATQSSPPATQVPVTIRSVQRGAVIEVHDCGVGLDDYRLTRAREIASGTRPVGLAELGEFPQTGLAVVGQYVRRHGFRVDVSESVYGGVRTIVGIPTDLVETVEPAETASAAGTAPVPEARAPEPSPVPAEDHMPGLPRRHSPRHTATAATAEVAGGTMAADAAAAKPAAPVGSAEEQPTPEQAGAWMGAFLGTTDNSTEQQEQEK